MVVIFGASHVNVWVAFIGFFLPLVMAFASPALRESRGNVWHTTLQGKV